MMLSIPMGVISETFPICGSRINAYIFLMSMLQVAFSLTMAFTAKDYPSENVQAAYTFFCFFGMAWTDTVLGGVIVRESRKDPEKGAEDLRIFEWITWGVGTFVPMMLGPGLFYEGLHLRVTTEFFVLTLNALLMASVAFFLPEKEMYSELDVQGVSAKDRRRF